MSKVKNQLLWANWGETVKAYKSGKKCAKLKWNWNGSGRSFINPYSRTTQLELHIAWNDGYEERELSVLDPQQKADALIEQLNKEQP